MPGLIPFIFDIFHERTAKRLADQRRVDSMFAEPMAKELMRQASTRVEGESEEDYLARSDKARKQALDLMVGPKPPKHLMDRINFWSGQLGKLTGGMSAPTAQDQSSVPEMAEPAAESTPSEVVAISAPVPPRSPGSMIVPDMPSTVARREARQAAEKKGLEETAVETARQPGRIQLESERRKSRNATVASSLARAGYRPKVDPTTGEMTDVEAIPEFELPETSRAQIRDRQSLAELRKSQQELASANADLANARAELARAGNDPSSPTYQLKLRALQSAQARANAVDARFWANYNALNLGRDTQGNPLPGALSRNGQPISPRFSRFYGPTAQILSRSQAAPAVTAMAENLQDFAADPKNADLFGPGSGRLAELERRFGTSDPRIAELRAKQVGLASLLVPLHGFRSQNAAESFLDTIRTTNRPEAFAAALQGHIDTALLLEDAAQAARTGEQGQIKELGGRERAAKGPPGAEKRAKRITATNPITGAKVESTDGGKTWHPIQK